MIVDQVFPHIGKGGLDPELDADKYSSFAFWRDPLLDSDSLGLEGLLDVKEENKWNLKALYSYNAIY